MCRSGDDTSAHIRTGTLLGERVLTLESAGGGTLHPLDVIPISRTSSPYSLTEAVSELTANADRTNTATLNQSWTRLSTTLDQIAPQLGPTFDGLTRLSQALNSRNTKLGELFKSASDVTGILSERSQQVNKLILNSNDLLQVLAGRRQRDRRTAGRHVGGVQAAVGVGARQREQTGADAGAS